MSDNKIFVDTNILVYRSFGSAEQKKIVHGLLKENEKNVFISVQVLNEFINACIKKYFRSEKELSETLFYFIQNFDVLPLNVETILQANEIRQRYKYSHYDSLIIASAIGSNCGTLYSEDLQHGQTIHKKLKIVNPFK